jgi:alpha-L-rhamnosidase
MYRDYDDLAVIRRDYANLAAYVDDLAGQIAPSGYIYQGTTFGDWSVPGNANPPSSQMLGTMFLYRETQDLAIMAAAIGNTAGATKYDSLAATIRTAVNNEFYDAPATTAATPRASPHALSGPNGVITSTAYDQTANVYGLAFGLAPDGDRQAIAAGLAANVTAQGNHLATGANGSKYILPMLTDSLRRPPPRWPPAPPPPAGAVVPAVRRHHHVGRGGQFVQHGPFPRPRLHGNGR